MQKIKFKKKKRKGLGDLKEIRGREKTDDDESQKTKEKKKKKESNFEWLISIFQRMTTMTPI